MRIGHWSLADRGCVCGSVQESLNLREEFVRSVLEDVVTGLRQSEHFSTGKAGAEAFKEFRGSEAPVLQAPDELQRVIHELFQSVLDTTQSRMAVVPGRQRDILHKFVDRDPIGPGVVGGEVACAGGLCEWLDDGHGQGSAGEQVESTDAELAGEWDATGSNSQWNRLTAECPGVHQDEAVKASGQGSGAAHADGPAPVVAEECDVLQVQHSDELAETVDVALQGITGTILWFFREATAEMIKCDDAEAAAECCDKSSPGKAPCGIAVDHQEWLSGAFVEVVLDTVSRAKPPGCEGVFRFKAVTILRPFEEDGGDIGAGEGCRGSRDWAGGHAEIPFDSNLAGVAPGSELDAADIPNGNAVWTEPSGAGADGVNDVTVIEIVVRIDLNFLLFLLFLTDRLECGDGAEDFGIESGEGLIAGAEALAVEGECLQDAGGVGLHANLEGWEFGVGDAGGAGGTERHADVEVAFGFEHFEGAHEENHELEHDVDHGRHVHLDFTGGATLELHGLWPDAVGVSRGVRLLDSGLSGLEREALEFDSGFLAHLDEFLDEPCFDGGVGADFDGHVFEAGADGTVEL